MTAGEIGAATARLLFEAGAIQVTVMPWAAVSSAQVRAIPNMPDFVAE